MGWRRDILLVLTLSSQSQKTDYDMQRLWSCLPVNRSVNPAARERAVFQDFHQPPCENPTLLPKARRCARHRGLNEFDNPLANSLPDNLLAEEHNTAGSIH